MQREVLPDILETMHFWKTQQNGPCAGWFRRTCFFAVGAFFPLSVGCKPEPAELLIETPQDHWASEGYVRMTPPVRLPGRKNGRDRTEVWLKLPEGTSLETQWLEAQQRFALAYPPGTVAARVEYRAWGTEREHWTWSVADVRGTRFDADREIFFSLRPTERRAHAPLKGFEWPRDDARQRQIAVDKLVAMAAHLASPEHRSRIEARARRNYDCTGCHAYNRADNQRPREHGFTNRGTDAGGFVLIQTVLNDRAPAETYFPVDTNAQDRFVRFTCGQREVPAKRTGSRHPTCADGSVPVGVIDLQRALTAGDQHARDVCDSRKYLFEHLQQSDRLKFREGFASCGLIDRSITKSDTM